MGQKKVYAVKKGKTTGLFYSWIECSEAVKGYPGAEFQGFKTGEEAKAYLEGRSMKEEKPKEQKKDASQKPKEKRSDSRQKDAEEEIETHTEQIRENRVIAYVDGSFDKAIGAYSFGCIILIPGGEIIEESGNGKEPDSLAIRNVAGEMLGAMYAAQWALVNGYKFIELRYDYEGIEKWATGAWKANNELTKKYAVFMQRKQTQIRISFRKVKAHSGDYYNERVDRLAKAALTEAEGIPKIQRQVTRREGMTTE